MRKSRKVNRKRLGSVTVEHRNYDFSSLERSYSECLVNHDKITLDRFLISSNYRFMFDYWKYKNSDQYKTSYSRKDAEPFVGKVIRLSGVIAGVRKFKSGWKILLRHPKIDELICESPEDFSDELLISSVTSSNLKESIILDSHMWVDVDKLLPYSKDYCNTTVNFVAGSMISVVCVLKPYKGRVEGGKFGIKYGFKDYLFLLYNYQVFSSSKGTKKGVDKYTGYNIYELSSDTCLYALVNTSFNHTRNVIPSKFCLFGIKFTGEMPKPGELLIYDDSLPTLFKNEADRIMELNYPYERRYELFKKLRDSELDKLIFRYSKEFSNYLKSVSRGVLPSPTIVRARVDSKNYRKERRKLAGLSINLETAVKYENEEV